MSKKRQNALGKYILSKLRESVLSVLPVTGLVVILYFTPFSSLTFPELKVFLISTLFLIIGVTFFNTGAEMSMTPMGEHIGSGLTKSGRLRVLITAGFLMGLFITVAEPDLSVLAGQLSGTIDRNTLIVTIGVGVGLFLLLGVIKIVLSLDLSTLLMFFYMVMFSFAALLCEAGRSVLLPLSFDAGGVTTGPVTVPFIMALGIGIAGTVGGKKSQENSFGLVALSSAGPVLSMLILSLLTKGGINYELPDYSIGDNTLQSLGKEAAATALEILPALFLIVLFFLILQITILKLPPFKLVQIGIGLLYTFTGLVMFLTAASSGFMPIGFKIGSALASGEKPPAAAVIFAFILGMATVLAEPAVQILNRQVEAVTDGNVKRSQMMIALSIGVGLSVGLSVLRIEAGFSILFYLIPGYIISLALSLYVPGLYTAIAFDSGGVASGPLTSSFVLPVIIGICAALKGEAAVPEYAFGVIAMVAMTPLIAIQVLGFRALILRRRRDKRAMRHIFSSEDEQIIYFDWEK